MTLEFDLTPDPRVLQMLGEINLDQWKCLAELIDNSVDAFVNARRQSQAISAPAIAVTVPVQDREDSAVTVRDNGPGMSIDQLEAAVRAGWSGNNPLDSLGLFGMGFNIATARLGMVTEVYTTRSGEKEWTGLRIDLNELRRTRSYHTPRLTRPKLDSSTHGTEIKVLRLKSDQRAFFARSANHQRIRRHLGRVYAPLLLSKHSSFTLEMNGQNVPAKRQCHWDPDRSVQGLDGRAVHAVEGIDLQLTPRRYCKTCMIAFTDSLTCPTGLPECEVVEIRRRLHGWLGLQRYMHEEDFGVDLIRNGRVIEVQNKDLFVWSGGDRPEREYPIDDQRNRGRFIGELHLDHCRVSYTKDRFERDDPSWNEMVNLVRGEGPLQPQKARSLGFGPQDAPLFRLFQAFRRSSPQGKTGRWGKILVVKNNERAIEMADLFNKGDPEYQTDQKWYSLIEEEDRAVVGASPSSNAPAVPPPDLPPGFLDEGGDHVATATDIQALAAEKLPKAPIRQRIESLSRIYKHPLLKVEFNVEAFAVDAKDPDLHAGAPWIVKLEDAGTRTWLFLFDPENPVFRSVTMTPVDALLAELANKAYEFLKDTMPASAVFATILAELRHEYATEAKLDSAALIAQADACLRDIGISIARGSATANFQEIFDRLPEVERDAIRRKVASSGASGLQSVINNGEFITYAGPYAARRFVHDNPKYFFDGEYWDQPYAGLDYGDEAVNTEARLRVLERFGAYLADAVWLATQSPRDLDHFDRDELIRAALSLRLLRADGAG